MCFLFIPIKLSKLCFNCIWLFVNKHFDVKLNIAPESFVHKVYVNEPILIVRFYLVLIAKYGEKPHTIGPLVMSYKLRSFFSTTLFGGPKTATVDAGTR